MNRLFKVGIAAMGIATVASVRAAQEIEIIEDEGAIGWTPIAIGIASPVQLPWGHAQWDVFGFDLNVLYSGNPKMYGLGVAGIGSCTFDDLIGLQVSGLFNYSKKNVYGMRLTCGANISPEGTGYGWDTAAFAYRKDMWGVDVNFLGSFQQDFTGLQIGGLANVCMHQSYGCEVAIGANLSKIAYGCQIAALCNMAEELHGCQIALVNYVDDCQWGFQIGLINLIMSNKLKILPFVNGCF